MIEKIAEASSRPRARTTGVVYLLFFLTAISADLFIRGLVVSSDAAITANNILVHQSLFRLHFAGGLMSTAFYIALTALFYGLFKPVNRTLALLAAFFSLAGCALGWLTFLSPPLANHLFTYIAAIGILAEALLMLWLLVKGVNEQRWQERASAAGEWPS